MFRHLPLFCGILLKGGIKMIEKKKETNETNVSLGDIKNFFTRKNSLARCRGQYPAHNKWFVCCVIRVTPTLGGEKAIAEVSLRGGNGQRLSFPLDPKKYPDKSPILPAFIK
jgi:hypothetical protein